MWACSKTFVALDQNQDPRRTRSGDIKVLRELTCNPGLELKDVLWRSNFLHCKTQMNLWMKLHRPWAKRQHFLWDSCRSYRYANWWRILAILSLCGHEILYCLSRQMFRHGSASRFIASRRASGSFRRWTILNKQIQILEYNPFSWCILLMWYNSCYIYTFI